MKRSDKIIGIIAVLAIVLLGVYLVKSRLIFDTPNEILFIALGVFSVPIFGLLLQFFVLELILKFRISSFKKIAKKYSLNHSFVKSSFFVPAGELNCLKGIVNKREVIIVDEQFSPDIILSAEHSFKVVTFPGQAGHIPRKSLNMRTKIIVDGLNKTPKYKQAYIFYRNPFMKISQIENFLEGLK